MDNYSVETLSRIVKVSILDTGLRAVININSEENLNGSISLEIMKEFLKNKKIIFGIDEELLQSFCESPLEYIGKEVEIAKGFKPVNGKDGYIVWEIENVTTDVPKELEDGSVDYYNLNKIINIKNGQLIASKVPSTKSIPGKSVNGSEIKGRNGKEFIFKIGKNVILNEDKDKIFAKADGQFVLTEKNKINVFPLYEVRGDLGFDVGNIDFVGTVIIKGNVPDGFKIKASGEIKIYGNVEGAEIKADGNIFIQQGIIGHNKSLVETKKSLTVAFILDANVKADEDINVTKSIMHSEVSAGKKVNCLNGKGIIVGGTVQAGDSIIANVIGNDLNTLTSIEVGINPLIRKEMNDIKREKKSLKESIEKISNGLILFDKMKEAEGVLPEKKIELQNKFIKQKLIIKKRLFEITDREKEIEVEINRINNSFVKVNRIIYPGSKLIIGDALKLISEEIKYAKFVQDDDIIKTIK